MATWMDEYHRRARRVVGVTDDTVEIIIETDIEETRGGRCETCFWTERNVKVEVAWRENDGCRQSRTFELGELMRLVDAVDEDNEEDNE